MLLQPRGDPALSRGRQDAADLAAPRGFGGAATAVPTATPGLAVSPRAVRGHRAPAQEESAGATERHRITQFPIPPLQPVINATFIKVCAAA